MGASPPEKSGLGPCGPSGSLNYGLSYR